MRVARGSSTYGLAVALVGIDPPIWRQVRVPGSITLRQLHMVIQIAMGWQNYHLHLFEVGDRTYASFEGDIGREVIDSTDVALGDLDLETGDRIVYEYDFGDEWRHRIEVDRVLRIESRVPRCVGGARACPPEDCGGVGGYCDLLEALSDAGHPEHEDMVKWTGGEYDPDHFDAGEVNRQLRWYWRHRDPGPSRRSIRHLCDMFLEDMDGQVVQGTAAQYSRDLELLCRALDDCGFYYGFLDGELLYERELTFTDVADVEPMLAYLEDFFRHFLFRGALVNEGRVQKCRATLRRFIGWLGEGGILEDGQVDSYRSLVRDVAREVLEKMERNWSFFRWSGVDMRDVRTWVSRRTVVVSAVREDSVDLFDPQGRGRWENVRAPEQFTRVLKEWSTYGVELIRTRDGHHLAGVLMPDR